eukprot:scaffold3021_cov236-Pinguiococcus_pyrenoidosus.AAC.2
MKEERRTMKSVAAARSQSLLWQLRAMVGSAHTLWCCFRSLVTLALLASAVAAEDFERILRGHESECLQQEAGRLVPAESFQKDYYDDSFPPVTLIRGFEYECKLTRQDVMAFGRRMPEMQQSVAFIHFFREVYPKTIFKSADELAPTDSLVFWPICGYSQGYMADPSVVVEAESDKNGIHDRRRARKPALLGCRAPIDNTCHGGTDAVQSVRAHPNVSACCRCWCLAPSAEPPSDAASYDRLGVDVGGGGNFYSVMIPQGLSPNLCPHDVPREAERPILVSFCGHVKPKGVFPSLRPRIAELLKGIIEKDGEKDVHASLSQPHDQYTKLFFESKFCFVTPGDTSSTSQGVRTMCGGCVPIWMYPDVRELPFVQILSYPSFSLLYEPVQLETPEDIHRLVDRLKVLLSSGEYDGAVENLHMARRFFDYDTTLPASPYGAALASILRDQAEHKCLAHGQAAR